MLKGALFDLDGVLLDTEYFQWKSWAEILKKFKISLSREKYFNYAGKSGSIVAEQLIKNFNLDIAKKELLEQKEKLVIKWFKRKTLKNLPFAKKAVMFFIKKGIKTAVVSGGPKKETILKLKKSGLDNLFEKIITGDNVKKGKPNPDIYKLGVKKLGLVSCECIAFEDTEYGVKSAKSAGLDCVAVPNKFSKKQDFSKADVVVGNLKEAINLVKEIYIIN